MKKIKKINIEFYKDIPIHPAILDAYKRILRIEVWLRRICFASYFFAYGKDYDNYINNPELMKTLRDRMRIFSDIAYFYKKEYSTIFDTLWIPEFKTLLQEKNVYPIFKDLTEVTTETLKIKLKELENLRNLVAHNHGFSKDAMKELDHLDIFFDKIISKFVYAIHPAAIKIMQGKKNNYKYSCLLGQLDKGWDVHDENNNFVFTPDTDFFAYKLYKLFEHHRETFFCNIRKTKYNYSISVVYYNDDLLARAIPQYAAIDTSGIDEEILSLAIAQYSISLAIPTKNATPEFADKVYNYYNSKQSMFKNKGKADHMEFYNQKVWYIWSILEKTKGKFKIHPNIP